MSGANGKNVTLVDCTLRDGGYFNDWIFDPESARALVRSLGRAGTDIIEVGYKTPRSHTAGTFEGLFRYCTESRLGFLSEQKRSEYAFMIDAKEFMDGDRPDTGALEETILPASESLFSYVRIATYEKHIRGCPALIRYFRDLGYRVTLNLMGMSLMTREEFEKNLGIVSTAGMDVFYFSDSFGDLIPADIAGCLSLVRKHLTCKAGIHTHDNNGLAFANTMTAIDHGIDFIDATLYGMGRGAGNLRTEQIMLYLYFRKGYSHLNPSELLEAIDSQMIPLREKYRWGWDYTYMLSALRSIHPTYCMNLRASNQYTIEQVSAILNGIDPAKRKSYSEEALLRAVDEVVNKPLSRDGPLLRLPPYVAHKEKEVLVIATGPGSTQYREEIREFIRNRQPAVIECNPKDDFFAHDAKEYSMAILNWARLSRLRGNRLIAKRPIITGIAAVPESYCGKMQVLTVPCHVEKDRVGIRQDGLTLPAYVVGMYAVGLALLSEPSVIYLAGFDGYPDAKDPKQAEMNTFWNGLKSPAKLISITPTSYPLEIRPVYTFIR